MKLLRAQWAIVLAVVLTAAIGIVTGLATIAVPQWLEPHLSLSWPLLGLLIILLVIVSLNRAQPSPRPVSREVDLDQFVRTVKEVEQLTGVDPGLENVDDWGRRLQQWEKTSEALARVARIPEQPAEGVDSQAVLVEPARLLMRLAEALLPTLWRRARWGALLDLASWAYKAAVAVEEWEQASWRAYDVARTSYTLERLTKCAEWTGKMDKALRYVDDQAERDQILTALYQMKGLLARDLQGSREQARADLQRALEISEQIGNTERAVLLLTQLGKLEELDGQTDKAMDLYEKALKEARQAENYDTQLDCYDKLARLGLALGEYKLAGHWCKQQLRLSRQMSRVFYEARALEGLGWVFFEAEDYGKAYEHARQALAIEEQITGPRAEAMQSLVIRIADEAMGVIPLVRP